MKRLFILLIVVTFCGVLAKGQSYFPNGYVNGVKNSASVTNETRIRKTVTVDGFSWDITPTGDTISKGTAIGDQVDANLIYGKLLPDTTAVETASFTLDLADASTLKVCTKTGNKLTVTIPANASVAIPIGTTINFVQGSTAIIQFAKAANVNLYSKKDSTCTGGKWAWAALYKRGTNNWILYGDIID